MNFTINRVQKSILSYLLDKYEKSKTYSGENLVTQKFVASPDKFLPEYYDDFADVDTINEFESSIAALEQKGLVEVERKVNTITRIIAVNEKTTDYYSLIGRTEIKAIRNDQILMYFSFKGKHEVLDSFCDSQIHRLKNGKKALYPPEEAVNIMNLTEHILLNDSDILERELSISVLKNSKLFSEKYRRKVCSILEKHGSFESVIGSIDDTRESDAVLLEEFHVYANPSYVYFKGNAEVKFSDGTVINISSDIPVSLSSSCVEKITNVLIHSEDIMTVENLTSYNRMSSKDTMFLYLSGYHNTVKSQFIRRIAKDNPGKTWKHFGDIDPDGFYILEHLIKNTGITFTPTFMSIEYITKYSAYCKPLTKNDIIKANSLISLGKYVDVMQYLLKNNCKLEQEIISWLE